MDTLETASFGIVLGFVLAAAGELLTLATVSTLGVALVGLCLPVGLAAMAWRLVRATGRHVGTRDHFVNVDGVLRPRR
jgi:peptidoglycan/LPS O-acetylase OafA/YrhL